MKVEGDGSANSGGPIFIQSSLVSFFHTVRENENTDDIRWAQKYWDKLGEFELEAAGKSGMWKIFDTEKDLQLATKWTGAYWHWGENKWTGVNTHTFGRREMFMGTEDEENGYGNILDATILSRPESLILFRFE